jgi:TrmH family RNA methyltransferase
MSVRNAKKILALKRRKYRDVERKYLIEGVRLCEEAVSSGAPIEQMIFCRETLGGNERLKQLWSLVSEKNIPIQETNRRAMQGMCETENPQGVLGVVEMAEWDRQAAGSDSRAVLLLDRIRDPGNLGLILRTAEAARVDAVFVSRESVEVHNPKVVRASMGSVFRLPVFRDQDLDKVITELQDRSVHLYAAHVDGTSHEETDTADSWALLLGNEAFGIDASLAKRADTLVSIPMAVPVESLNVAVASGILLYRLNRKQLTSAQA